MDRKSSKILFLVGICKYSRYTAHLPWKIRQK